MGKNVLDARFGAKKGSQVSLIWRLWATKHGDIYLKSIGSIPSKFSFHKSGICRDAFTSESRIKPNGQDDRALRKWFRAQPPPKGLKKIVSLAYIQIPTDYLSRETTVYPKKVDWIATCKHSSSLVFFLFLTNEPEQVVMKEIREASRPATLLKFATFKSGVSVVLAYFFREWKNEEITLGGEGRVNDIIISHEDPLSVGRPIRVTRIHSSKSEKHYTPWLIEQGAYAIEGDLPNKRENDEWVNFHNPPQK